MSSEIHEFHGTVCGEAIYTKGGKVSDGYHTFDELYDHRITLWIALCRVCDFHEKECSYGRNTPTNVWRSKLHSDGTGFDGWFVLGMGRPAGKQITYHLPMNRWTECDFAETLDRAPEFDGHTPADVLERLKLL